MESYKRNIFIFIVVISLMPLVQSVTSVVKFDKLDGSYQVAVAPKFIWKHWFTGNFQHKMETYLDQQAGFREFLIRLSNQLRYNFFKQSQANGVIVGKDDYLFEEAYIHAHFGYDYVGRESVSRKLDLLKEIQTILKSRGTDIVLVLAPGKASFYPEKIPDNYSLRKGWSHTNYYLYRNGVLARKINHIDVNNWFVQAKDSSKYNLYPKTGIHWSRYGELLFLDSLMSYLNQLKPNFELPDVELIPGELSEEMRFTDEDIEEGMNILFDIQDDPIYYPSFKINYPQNQRKPKGMFLADSYFSNLYDDTISLRIFDNAAFWYYNREIYFYGNGPIDYFDNDLIQSLNGLDYIVMIITESNLKDLGFGFIEQYHTALTDPDRFRYEFKIREVEHAMWNNPDWLAQLQSKAKNSGKTLEQVMREDALYIIEEGN